MQSLQLELEKINEKNSSLEQDFENEINRKNKNSKEIGQIINSINNIYGICRDQLVKRNKLKSAKPDIEVKEDTPNLVQELINRLESAAETIEDLKSVLDAVQIDFDRDKAYTEGVFNQAAPVGRLGMGAGNQGG